MSNSFGHHPLARRIRFAIVGLIAAKALSSCQIDARPSETATPTMLPSLLPDQFRDGWQCNSALPVGEVVARRNDLTLWRIGVAPKNDPTEDPIYLLAAGKSAEGCRFFFLNGYSDTHFEAPIVYPFEATIYAPFSGVLDKMIQAEATSCFETALAATRLAGSNPCVIGVENRIVKSASQITSHRWKGQTFTAKSYLFINGEVIDDTGQKLANP